MMKNKQILIGIGLFVLGALVSLLLVARFGVPVQLSGMSSKADYEMMLDNGACDFLYERWYTMVVSGQGDSTQGIQAEKAFRECQKNQPKEGGGGGSLN